MFITAAVVFRFILKYRMSKEAFMYVFNKLNLNEGVRSTYIPPILRLACTLQVLGSGGYQWLAAEDINMPLNQGTLSLVMTEVLHKIENILCPKWIQFSPSENNETKNYFFSKYKIPGGLQYNYILYLIY